MPTRSFFPVLTIAAAGSFFLACGSPDRIFVDLDSGVPPRDSSSGPDATPDAPSAADQQSDARVDGAMPPDAPLPEASTDGPQDAVSDPGVDAPTDGRAPDMVQNDTAINDIAVSDTAVNDSAVSDKAADIDGPIDGGWMPDATPDILDCSMTSSPRITPSGSVGICPGKTVTLTSTAAASYLWSTSATTQAIDVGAAGSYTVTTNDTRGCVATSAPTVVNVYPTPPPPTITASGPTRFCNGGSVTLSTGPASSYAWSTGETTQSIVVSTSGNYYVTAADLNGCGPTTSATTAVTVVVPSTGSRSYAFIGAADSFVVPECVTWLTVDAYGAQGGSANAPGVGGYGGEVYARLNVTPGAVLQVRVGGAGALCTVDNTGGFNGGGVANCAGTINGPVTIYSATGGGATDIRVSPHGLDDRVIVAGGGGGAGYNCGSATQDSGGVGGGAIGGTFPTTCGTHPESAGTGGTQTGGGLGGTYPGYGYAGSGQYGLGGSGVSTGGGAASEGGGGGGGYFGGGGGCWVGGGGGSDYIRTTVASLLAQYPGSRPGHGVMYLSW